MRPLLAPAFALAVAVGAATVAHGEAGLSLAPAFAKAPAPGTKPAGLKLPRPGADFALSYSAAAGAGHPSQGRTALDRRVGDGLNASVGYLCGIDRYAPDSYQHGGGPDSGYGHKGTFLGASLGYSFK